MALSLLSKPLKDAIMIHFEAFVNVVPGKRNYIVISEIIEGRVHVNNLVVDWSGTPEIEDYFDANAVDLLAVGESCRLSDSNAVVVRIA